MSSRNAFLLVLHPTHLAPGRKDFGRVQSFAVKQQVSAFLPLFQKVLHHLLLNYLMML